MRLRGAGVKEETISDILWHNRRSITAHSSMAQIVEIRDALELITDERHRFNKSLASLIREKSPHKVPTARKKRVRLDGLTLWCNWRARQDLNPRPLGS
jgi:hypothetical protein